MLRFIAKRLAYGLLVIAGVVIVVFFIFHILPGENVYQFLGNRVTKDNVERLNREFGFDKPLHIQLVLYFNDLSPISIHDDTPANATKYEYVRLFGVADEAVVVKLPYLRKSFRTDKPVGEILLESLEGTFWLALVSMCGATVVGVIFGLIAALNKNTWIDHFLVTASVAGFSSPSFVTAILISIVFGYWLHSFTGLPMTGSLWRITSDGQKVLELKNIILPSITLGIRPLSTIVQLARNATIEVLAQDYIRTARAKGLSPWMVIVKHTLRNALNPVITAVSSWLAALMTGAFFVEYIFNWKGLGWKTITAVNDKDLPVIMGSTIAIACIFILINIVTDILYAIADPRIRLS
jgi:peptide/nickel transport system permease protein